MQYGNGPFDPDELPPAGYRWIWTSWDGKIWRMKEEIPVMPIKETET